MQQSLTSILYFFVRSDHCYFFDRFIFLFLLTKFFSKPEKKHCKSKLLIMEALSVVEQEPDFFAGAGKPVPS